ncbi:uncharacterized protein BDZ99DRAFT_521597 [Mytilinidion resinicola]|uniref:Uncharacterized protein n=1 Tax=Mytilinidion resinicola TaxID=574789 RepID=A0A6A6YJV1_9PEZI|nr:uncharacterized protein BDZ99DRAFT_521597 [Mytilinidion resinicola]KAF2809146.1 hypothetical protein BDZ99DRAFT_521597 [Mytilinidion resinicola]
MASPRDHDAQSFHLVDRGASLLFWTAGVQASSSRAARPGASELSSGSAPAPFQSTRARSPSGPWTWGILLLTKACTPPPRPLRRLARWDAACEQHKASLPSCPLHSLPLHSPYLSLPAASVLAVPPALSACAVLVAIHNAWNFTPSPPNHRPAAQPAHLHPPAANANTSRTVSSPITVQLRPSIHQPADIPPPPPPKPRPLPLPAALSLHPRPVGLHLSALATRALARPERP